MGNRSNRHDEPALMAGLKPLLTEFSIYHRWILMDDWKVVNPLVDILTSKELCVSVLISFHDLSIRRFVLKVPRYF